MRSVVNLSVMPSVGGEYLSCFGDHAAVLLLLLLLLTVTLVAVVDGQ